MIAPIKRYCSRVAASFRQNPRRSALLLAIALFVFATLLTISLLSGSDRWHNLPLAFAGIMASLMIAYVFFYGHFFLDIPTACLVLFPIYVLLASIWGQFDSSVITPFLLAGMALASYQFLCSSKLIKEFLLLWLGALIVFALVLAVLYWREIVSLDVGRIGQALNNINIVAEFLCIGFALALYFLFRKQWLSIVPLLLFGALGLLTGSKQFVIGVVVVVIAAVFLAFGKKRWYFSLLTIAGLIGVGILILQLPIFDVIRQRLISLFDFFSPAASAKQQDGSNTERLAMIIEGFYLFGKSPIIGLGKKAFVNQSYFGTYAHNTLANLACDFGLIGIVLFLAPWIVAFAGTRKKATSDPQYRNFLWMGILLVVVLSLARVLIDDKAYYLLLPLILSAARYGADTSRHEFLSIRFYRGRLDYYGLYYDRKKKELVPFMKKQRYKI